MIIERNAHGIGRFAPNNGFVVKGDTPAVGEVPAGSIWHFANICGKHFLTLVDLPEAIVANISMEEYDEFLETRTTSFMWDYSGSGQPEIDKLEEAVEFMFVVAKDLVDDKDFRQDCWPDASPFLPGKEKDFVEAFREIMQREGFRVIYG